MWFLADFETVEALRAIDNKNNFDLGESGSREGIHQPEKPWLFEVLKATSDIRCVPWPSMPRFRATRPRPSWVAAILEYQGRLLSFAVNKSFECVVKLPWLPWLGFQLLRFSKTLFHNSLPPFTCSNVPVLPFEFHVLRRSVLRKLNGVFLVFPLVPYRLFPSWSHEGYVLFHTGIFLIRACSFTVLSKRALQ